MGLSVYDLCRLCFWDKSVQTLRKYLENLISRGFVVKQNNALYGVSYYRAVPELYVENNSLVAMLEGRDLASGDYYTAAILNFFRQRMLTDGQSCVEVSAREIKDTLRLDRSRSAIRSRLADMERAKVLKGSLSGRIYRYELSPGYFLNNRTLEALQELGGRLSELFFQHLKRFNLQPDKNSRITFQRMLLDGYSYEAIQHIIAYLGYKESRWREIILKASHIRKHYSNLYDIAYRSLSRRKACRYLYKLANGLLGRIVVEKEKKSAPAESIKLSAVGSPAVRTDESIWLEAAGWVEANKKLILYAAYKSDLSTILEDDDILSMVRQFVFDMIKKGKSLAELSFAYLKKCLFHFLRHELPCGKKLPADDYLPSAVQDEQLTDYSEMEIPAELRGFPSEAINIVLDYFDRDGRKYTQRELAKKYGMSLGKLNGILQEYVPKVCKLYNLPPPPKFYSGKNAK